MRTGLHCGVEGGQERSSLGLLAGCAAAYPPTLLSVLTVWEGTCVRVSLSAWPCVQGPCVAPPQAELTPPLNNEDITTTRSEPAAAGDRCVSRVPRAKGHIWPPPAALRLRQGLAWPGRRPTWAHSDSRPRDWALGLCHAKGHSLRPALTSPAVSQGSCWGEGALGDLVCCR